jgi:hypothetical protein
MSARATPTRTILCGQLANPSISPRYVSSPRTRSAACLRLALIRHSRTGGWIQARNPTARVCGAGIRSRPPDPVEGATMPARGGRAQEFLVSRRIRPSLSYTSGRRPQSIDAWRRDIDRLSMALADTAQNAGSSCVIVAGDFNSTIDMRPFRALLRHGYRDAGEHSGAGFTPTFPANSRLRPLITMDHILTRNRPSKSLHTISIPGSDYGGIVADVLIQMRGVAAGLADSPQRY